MDGGKPVEVLIGLQGGFVHQAANGIVRHQQTVKFLLHPFRRLTTQYDLRAAQVRFQFVQSSFDFPSLVVQGGLLSGRGLLVIKDGGVEPVQWLGVRNAFQAVIYGADDNPLTLVAPVASGGVKYGSGRSLLAGVFHLQACILARAP